MRRPFAKRAQERRVYVDEFDVTGMLPSGLEALYRRPRVRRLIAKHFNRAYYYDYEHSMFTNRWLGYRCLKYPTDMWSYQELMAQIRPAVVVETGTFHGGSALFLANVMDALDHGRVISVDIEARDGRPEHPRISYVTGSSVDPEIVAEVRRLIAAEGPVMVILDSDHACAHVRAEMEIYSELVELGSYMVVEDTNVNGHPVYAQHGPGPMEAVRQFLDARSDFRPDVRAERAMLTANPDGYLRRVAEPAGR